MLVEVIIPESIRIALWDVTPLGMSYSRMFSVLCVTSAIAGAACKKCSIWSVPVEKRMVPTIENHDMLQDSSIRLTTPA